MIVEAGIEPKSFIALVIHFAKFLPLSYRTAFLSDV